MKFNKKYLFYLLGVLGVFSMLYVYNFIFLDYQDKTTALANETTVLKRDIADLEEKAQAAGEYEDKMNQMNVEMAYGLENFAEYYQMEDVLMMLYDMAGGNGFFPQVDLMQEVVITAYTPEILYTTGNSSTLPAYGLYNKKYDLGLKTTYQGMKDLVNYLYNTDTLKNINQISFSFDESSGLLKGDVIFNQFFLTGTGQPYEDPYVPVYSTGVSNLFGETAAEDAMDYERIKAEKESLVEEE